MSTDQSLPLTHDGTTESAPGSAKRGWGGWVAGAALAAFVLFFIANCRTALDPRVANPNVQGRPRPVKFLFGLDYITFLHISTVIMLLVVFIRGWRRNPGSPVMLMFLCTTLIVWQDPIMNWSPFAVYNPDLIHWPESWPLVSISPSVEPFVVFGYVMFYFGPYFPAIWILRKLQARRGPQAFVSRHPLVSLGLLTLVIGFVFDAW
ncbi:MAG: spirocyclase AveC family protein, partial [Mycobacterium sp.]